MRNEYLLQIAREVLQRLDDRTTYDGRLSVVLDALEEAIDLNT